jgi:hypothetical protein
MPCVRISSPQKFKGSACTVTNMAVKRTGVVEKHCSAFALFFNGFHEQTEEVYIVQYKTKTVGND